jgi:hypothetical protein
MNLACDPWYCSWLSSASLNTGGLVLAVLSTLATWHS